MYHCVAYVTRVNFMQKPQTKTDYNCWILMSRHPLRVTPGQLARAAGCMAVGCHVKSGFDLKAQNRVLFFFLSQQFVVENDGNDLTEVSLRCWLG